MHELEKLFTSWTEENFTQSGFNITGNRLSLVMALRIDHDQPFLDARYVVDIKLINIRASASQTAAAEPSDSDGGRAGADCVPRRMRRHNDIRPIRTPLRAATNGNTM